MLNLTTILLADDDQDDRFFLRQAFNSVLEGVNFIEAVDGIDLLNKIFAVEATKISLILIDMNMPRMNGLEAINAIKANPVYASIPTIMLSTSTDPNLPIKARIAGVSSFFCKPDSYQGFIELAHQMVNLA